MRNLRRNAAVVGGTAVITALGLGGVMSAQADTATTPSSPAVQRSDGTPIDPDQTTRERSTEKPEVEQPEDGPDKGPDADPNEPGHQDADDAGEPE